MSNTEHTPSSAQGKRSYADLYEENKRLEAEAEKRSAWNLTQSMEIGKLQADNQQLRDALLEVRDYLQEAASICRAARELPYTAIDMDKAVSEIDTALAPHAPRP